MHQEHLSSFLFVMCGHILYICGGSGSGGRGHPLLGRLVVGFPVPPDHVPMCPWARLRTPNSSHCWVSTVWAGWHLSSVCEWVSVDMQCEAEGWLWRAVQYMLVITHGTDFWEINTSELLTVKLSLTWPQLQRWYGKTCHKLSDWLPPDSHVTSFRAEAARPFINHFIKFCFSFLRWQYFSKWVINSQ